MKITNWESIPKFLDALTEDYRVIAPVREGRVNFREIGSGSEVTPDFRNTKSSPKRFFVRSPSPAFSTGDYLEDMKNIKFEIGGKSLIFGIRPCDIKALSILDRFYFDGLLSHDYEKNRRRTVIVGMNCTWPGDNCFCTAFGAGPSVDKGADIVFTDLGNLYSVEIMSDGGREIIERFPDMFMDAKEEHRRGKKKLMEKARERIKGPNLRGIKRKIGSIGEKYWEGLDEDCIGCYSCDIVCPTVHSLEHGKPRKAGERFRYKLNHVKEEHGSFGCVGCGRCLEACPRGIGMHGVVEGVRRQ